MKSLVIFTFIFLSGCAGVGLMSTSDPDVKIQQAYRMMNEDRGLMAEDLVRQAMVIYIKDKNTLGMAEAYHTYGNLYKNSAYHGKSSATFKKQGTYDGTYMKSINNFEKSKEAYEQAGNEVGAVKSLVGMGNAYHLRNEDTKACKYYELALSRYNTGTANGVITNEPVIFDKRYKNMGDIINAFINREKCST